MSLLQRARLWIDERGRYVRVDSKISRGRSRRVVAVAVAVAVCKWSVLTEGLAWSLLRLSEDMAVVGGFSPAESISDSCCPWIQLPRGASYSRPSISQLKPVQPFQLEIDIDKFLVISLSHIARNFQL